MTSVTPYSGRFAGYKIEKGKLSIDVAYQVENRQLKAEQRFVIDQLQLGERVESPDAVHLPLRLAVALLKDRNGVIDINLPLTGSLDDPQFRLGPLIWKAFVGLLTKVATAPFALLGSLFGGDEKMSLIDFEPGSAELDATAQERTRNLLKALNERPQLQLEVPTLYSPQIDRPVLARKRLDEKLGPGGTPDERFERLEKQYREAFGAKAELPAAAASVAEVRKKKRDPQALEAANTELTDALIAKEPVADKDLQELGQSRAHAVQAALLDSGEIDPQRVFILGAAETQPTDNKVQLKLSLR
jgi:outer membrane protein OmpA-like peptidoglycan-associated protein